MKNGKGTRGFIAVFWLSLFIIVLVAFNTTVLYNLVDQQISLTKRRELLMQNFYYADLSNLRGLWLYKDGGRTSGPGDPDYSEYLYIDPATFDVVFIDDGSNDIVSMLSIKTSSDPQADGFSYRISGTCFGVSMAQLGGAMGKGVNNLGYFDGSYVRIDWETAAIVITQPTG